MECSRSSSVPVSSKILLYSCLEPPTEQTKVAVVVSCNNERSKEQRKGGGIVIDLR